METQTQCRAAEAGEPEDEDPGDADCLTHSTLRRKGAYALTMES